MSEVLGSGTKTAWTISLTALRSAIGNGGATASGNVTLLASSAGAQSITPTGWGQYVTLPDATLLSKNAQVFNLANAGAYPYGVKDSAGTVLGWIAPGKAAMLGLADNATAAGVWVVPGLDKVAITSEVTLSLANSGAFYQQSDAIVALDATRNLVLIKNSSTALYGVVHDTSDNTWGSPTLVRTGAGGTIVGAIKSATDQALVVSCNATTGLEAVVLSIAGKTITVNTAATATLGGNINAASLFDLVQVGSSFVIGYNRVTSTTAIRALTIAGTTVTLGAETALSTVINGGADWYALFGVSSSVLLAIYTDVNGGTGIVAKPFTIAGTTITPGTGVTVTTNAGVGFRAGAIGSRWWVIHRNVGNTAWDGSIVSVSGTTATKSTAASLSTLSSNTFPDPVAISATKLAVFGSESDGGKVNILTDTAGTASAGTELSTTLYTSTATGTCLGRALVDGNNLHLLGAKASTGSTSDEIYKQVIDCSGASPAAGAIRSTSYDETGLHIAFPGISTRANRFTLPNVLTAGKSWFCMAGGVTTPGGRRKPYGSDVGIGLLPEAAQLPCLSGRLDVAIGKVGQRMYAGAMVHTGAASMVLSTVECAA